LLSPKAAISLRNQAGKKMTIAAKFSGFAGELAQSAAA
jgi:hypothetical protein